jgi:hypothetical protein
LITLHLTEYGSGQPSTNPKAKNPVGTGHGAHARSNAIEAFEREIVDAPVEHTAFFDWTGRKMHEEISKSSVRAGLNSEMVESLIAQGAVDVIHNHPNGTSLSPGDVELATYHRFNSIEAISKMDDGVHRFKIELPAGEHTPTWVWNIASTLEDRMEFQRDKYQKAFLAIHGDKDYEAKANQLTQESSLDFWSRDFTNELQHRFGLKYTDEKVKW